MVGQAAETEAPLAAALGWLVGHLEAAATYLRRLSSIPYKKNLKYTNSFIPLNCLAQYIMSCSDSQRNQ